MSKREDSAARQFIDYTKTLLKGGGVPALYGGFGLLLVAGGGAYLASSWSTNPALAVVETVGVLMIILGHRQRMAEIRAGKIALAVKVEAKIVSEEEAVSLLAKGWEYMDTLPSGRLVVMKRTARP